MTVITAPRNSEPSASSTRGLVLVVDDHRTARESIAEILRQAGHRVDHVSSAVEALRLVSDESYDVIISDLQMPGMDGLEFIHELGRRRYGAQTIMVTAHGTVASAVQAMRDGAFDYIEKPFDAGRLERLVSRAVGHGRLMDQDDAFKPRSGQKVPVVMIGDSRPMQALRDEIARAAPTAETILITGESGTGKELVARMIHDSSPRAGAPLVSLNCPVLSAQLMESELFGHERGAFTGADSDRTGRFELAGGGTILLDEVTEIDLGLQAKLLRVLQERSFERVGSSRTITVDVRVLATTNRNLQEEVEAQRFRADLYYRLAVLPVEVPPLRRRSEDIPALVEHFLIHSARRQKKEPVTLGSGVYDLLAGYHWPGNIRELENIITRASVLGSGDAVTADQIRPWLIDADGSPGDNRSSDRFPVGLSLQEMERKLIETTLEQFDGHRANTAGALGIGLRTLSGKLKSYGYAPRAKVPTGG